MKNHENLILRVVVFVATIAVYILTLSPTVSFTDSGELAGVASTLGIAHPTGYPLFSIIGYLWTLLPLPLSPILKLNLLSALLVAFSNVLFFHTFKTVASYLSNLKQAEKPKSKDKTTTATNEASNQAEEESSKFTAIGIIAAMLAISLGFAQTVWEQAVMVEVYSLHFLLLNISLYFGLNAFIKKDNKLFLVTAFFIGLGFANHLTTLLILPAMVFIFFAKEEKGFDLSPERLKSFLVLFLPLFIGLSVYIYMPIRAAMSPEFNWGDVSRSFDKFLYHVSGKQYQVWMFSGFDAWAENFKKFFGAFFSVFAVLYLIPFIISLNKIKFERNKLKWLGISLFAPIALPFAFLSGKSKQILWFFILMIISGIAYSFNYSIHDIDPYFYSAYLAIFVLLGLSIALFAKEMKYFALATVVVPLLLLIFNYEECDMSNDYSVEDFTRTLVDNLPQNSIIISAQWDYWCSAFWYLQRVEGYRPDVVLIEKELMRRTWYPSQFAKWYPDIAEKSKLETARFMKDLELFESGSNYNPMSIQQNFISLFNSYIDKNIDERPVFITLDVMQTEEQIGQTYFKIPQGYAFRLVKTNDTLPLDLSKIYIDRFEKSLNGKSGHLYEGIGQAATVALINLGKYGYITGQREKALEAVEMARRLDRRHPEIESLYKALID